MKVPASAPTCLVEFAFLRNASRFSAEYQSNGSALEKLIPVLFVQTRLDSFTPVRFHGAELFSATIQRVRSRLVDMSPRAW